MAKRGKKLTGKHLRSLKGAVLDLIISAFLVHDAKDGFIRAQHWPAFSVAVKHIRRVLR